MAGLSRDVRAGGGVWAGLGVVESSIEMALLVQSLSEQKQANIPQIAT